MYGVGVRHLNQNICKPFSRFPLGFLYFLLWDCAVRAISAHHQKGEPPSRTSTLIAIPAVMRPATSAGERKDPSGAFAHASSAVSRCGTLALESEDSRMP